AGPGRWRLAAGALRLAARRRPDGGDTERRAPRLLGASCKPAGRRPDRRHPVPLLPGLAGPGLLLGPGRAVRGASLRRRAPLVGATPCRGGTACDRRRRGRCLAAAAGVGGGACRWGGAGGADETRA